MEVHLALDEQLLTQISCAMCKNVMVEPVIFLGCGHEFCANCFEESGQTRCPTCRSSQMIAPSIRTRTVLSTILVHCVLCGDRVRNSETSDHFRRCPKALQCNHCEEKVSNSEALRTHLQSCQGKLLSCFGCAKQIRSRRMDVHVSTCFGFTRCCDGFWLNGDNLIAHRAQTSTCPFHTMKCPFGCGESVQNRDLKSHVAATAPGSCSQAKLCPDCCEPVSTKMANEHVALCPRGRTYCSFCGGFTRRDSVAKHDRFYHTRESVVCSSRAVFHFFSDNRQRVMFEMSNFFKMKLSGSDAIMMAWFGSHFGQVVIQPEQFSQPTKWTVDVACSKLVVWLRPGDSNEETWIRLAPSVDSANYLEGICQIGSDFVEHSVLLAQLRREQTNILFSSSNMFVQGSPLKSPQAASSSSPRNWNIQRCSLTEIHSNDQKPFLRKILRFRAVS